MNVLITDGENRSALAMTRSLGRLGCRVVVAGSEVRNLSSCSGYCQQAYRIENSTSAGTSYVQAISEIVSKEEIDIIFPMTEVSIYLLNAVKDRSVTYGNAVLACPPEPEMAGVSDKVALFQRAEDLGIAIPKTLYLRDASDLADRIGKINQYPVVVKPALSRVQQGGGFIAGGVKYAHSENELKTLYATQEVLRYPSMIQEKIHGPGTGLFSLFDKNRHLALFSHQRLREKPPSGGVSVVCQSVELDSEMVEAANRLLSAVGWKGVAMVEFKRDLRDGKAKLMEINGRFWGSLQLAIACGVDFPALLLDYHQGKDLKVSLGEYRVGQKLKWFYGTLDHFLIRLKNRSESLNLPKDAPSKWGAAVEFFKIWEKNTSFDVFDRGDLGPFWFESRAYIRQALRSKGAS